MRVSLKGANKQITEKQLRVVETVRSLETTDRNQANSNLQFCESHKRKIEKNESGGRLSLSRLYVSRK